LGEGKDKKLKGL